MSSKHYFDLQSQTLESIKGLNPKPTLCMHVCCGPCSTFPLSFLCDYFDLTLYFNNSNIYPINEYIRRLEELKHYLVQAKLPVKLIVAPYDDRYIENIAPYASDFEGGRRCQLCYRLRMDEAYHYAHTQHFNYFCTVMSISRQKNSLVLNQIGEELALKYPKTKYFYSDFKKQNGTLIGQQISSKYQLYRQNYCGCIYSYQKKHVIED